MEQLPNRRTYLATLGALGIAGVAGCSQDSLTTDSTQTEAPTSNPSGANFTFEYDAQAQRVTIQYNGGGTLHAGNLQVRSETGTRTEWSQLGSTTTGSDAQLRSGATAVIGPEILNWGQAVGPNDTIRLVFAAGDGPSTLGRFTPTESMELTSTVPSTPTPDPPVEPTEEPPTEEPPADTVAPSITAFSISNPAGQKLRISFESDEELATVQVRISGEETVELTTGEFSVSAAAGGYAYETTYQASTDGRYTATLGAAADNSGNDGATGASVAVTVATTDEIVAQEQLISRWPFEDSLADVVGDNDASAERGDTAFDSYAGRRALRFDGDLGVMINRGENSELSIMDPDNAGATVGGWIYFDAAPGGNPNEDNTRHHILRNDNEYNFVAVPSDDLESFQFRFAGMNESANGEMTVSSEEWHHFVFAIEPGSSAQFYLDGEQVFETDIDLSNPTETAYWSHETIGSWYGTNNPTWYDLLVGKMADLRIYDTKLTGAEIAQIYEKTSSDSGSDDATQTSYTAQNGLAYHDGHIYTVSDGEILKVDRSTDDVVNRFAAPSDSRPTGLAYGNGSLWFADAVGPDYDGEIVELDPDTGEVRSSITSSWDPRGLAFGDGSLWAVDITTNSIVEFSPDGDRLSSFDTPGVTWGQGLAYFDGSLWLGNNCSGDGCTVSLREYDTDGTQIQRTGERSSSSTAPYAGLAATETELLGPGADGELTVLRTL